MALLAKPLSYLLTWLYDLVGNYGVAILILTIIIKICLYPLYAKQIKSTAKMTDMQPKVQEIQQKYAKDKNLMNEKMMELYKNVGVNMYGGCLPMFVQMFIIMGLFGLLRNPMTYINSDKMLFAIHESFLWIQDLVQPDPWILPILAGIATFVAYSMNSMSMGGTNAQQNAAGLAIYWFGSQVIQIFYNIRFNKWRKDQKMARAEKEAREKAKKKKARA